MLIRFFVIFLLGFSVTGLNATKASKIICAQFIKRASSAQSDLFHGYYLMHQGAKCRDEAKKYLRSAAMLGEPYSQYLLSTLVDDENERQKWLSKAHLQGIGWEEYVRATDYYFPNLPLPKE